jgi:hypothetical protein
MAMKRMVQTSESITKANRQRQADAAAAHTGGES